jgi:hypothetical protein
MRSGRRGGPAGEFGAHQRQEVAPVVDGVLKRATVG